MDSQIENCAPLDMIDQNLPSIKGGEVPLGSFDATKSKIRKYTPILQRKKLNVKALRNSNKTPGTSDLHKDLSPW